MPHVTWGMLHAAKSVGRARWKMVAVFLQTALVFFKIALVFSQTALVFFQTAAVFSQTAAVFGRILWRIERKRPVADVVATAVARNGGL